MDQYQPSVVLLMIGSNDMSNGEDPSTLKGEIEHIVDTISAKLPSTTVFVSTLTPLVTGATGYEKIPAANDAIKAGVAAAAAKGEHVVLVEQNVTVADLIDGTHPNASGNTRIAEAWYNAMSADSAAHGGLPSGAWMPIYAGETAVAGSQGNDDIRGNDASNWLSGEGGNDNLFGGAGNDTLIGGAGKDYLWGGPGGDTFVFLSRSDSGKTISQRDVIMDFEHRDRVDLRSVDANSHRAGDQAFKLVPHFTGTEGQLQWTKISGGFVLNGDLNGDAKSDFSIVVKTHLSQLHSYDFYF